MISIIIPTYNEEKYIGRTLLNLRDMVNVPHEIIVSDDKSMDSTVTIAKQYTDNVLIPEMKHGSIAANRNTGASHAKGDLLMFIDGSCIIEDSNLFYKVIARFKSNPNLVALTGKLGVWKELETRSDRIVYFFFNLVHLIKNNIFHTGEAAGKFQVIRKNAFIKVGGYNERLITREDADIFQRLAKNGRTYYDSSLIVRHSGRRAHTMGWPKLLSIWMIETFWVAIKGHSRATDWSHIR